MANFNDIKIGDKVEFTLSGYEGFTGQEGIVTTKDEYKRVHYRITKAAAGHEASWINEIGRVTTASAHKLTVIEPEKPESEFTVGDTVYLTKKGTTKDGLPALKNRLKATVTRVQWYAMSKEYGYYLEIPGVTDVESLSWVDTYEFYEGEFEAKKNLKKVTVERLQEQKRGTVVMDSDGDKWVYIGKNTWVHAMREKDTYECTADSLVSMFGPISLI